MQRKAVKLVGLVLVGAAAFSALRRWLHRSDGDPSDPPVEPSPLVSVPDLAPEPIDEPEPVVDPEPVVETQTEPVVEPEPVVEADPDAEPSRWRPPLDGGCPPGYPIKVNERSGIYHVPDGLSYERTRPTRCYVDAAAAEADGFRRAKR